jgi:corrinoid protein of di/trimethylamine methyltransferase
MDLSEVRAAVEGGKRVPAEKLTREAIDAGELPTAVLERALIPAMAAVGEKFARGEYFVPEMLMAAKAMKTCMDILRPLLVKADFQPIGKVVLGTVRGDLHDIGKNLVKMMMEGAGLEVHDLGVDVPAAAFIAAAIEYKADLLCCSALLTTTMSEMKSVVEAAKAAGIREKVRIMIGGAPINDAFRSSIEADLYAPDAASAAEVAALACRKSA